MLLGAGGHGQVALIAAFLAGLRSASVGRRGGSPVINLGFAPPQSPQKHAHVLLSLPQRQPQKGQAVCSSSRFPGRRVWDERGEVSGADSARVGVVARSYCQE
ncbi:hypothetical protein BD289DRAFT_269709 [Coniella lustricola]|uniref:Uncharacterized protein n=1 Tax=Coniella lustricola TaxID=2025994 RepID=A0A2T3AKJ2_9PEZI|nr:hypothetical protein BD289DRAFT_269709 [Coniella lustricola]